MKKFLLLVFVMSVFILRAENVMKIGEYLIKEKDIAPSPKQVSYVLQNKFKISPSDKKYKEQEVETRLLLAKLKLALITNKSLFRELEKKFAPKVVSQEDIDKLKEHSFSQGKIQRNKALLNAINYTKESKDKDRYKIAYEKYLKQGNVCSYEFFKNNCDKQFYADFLKKQLNNFQSNELSTRTLSEIFQEKLPDYILKETSQNDSSVAEHLKLSATHKCNYKNNLIKSWLIKEADKIGYQIYNNKYGSNIEEVLWPPVLQDQE